MTELIVTCEHATPYLPDNTIAIPGDVPEHRLYDKGALECAEHFAKLTSAKLFTFAVSRLLVDGNRSVSNPNLFSKYAKAMDEDKRHQALQEYYLPFRRGVYEAVSASKFVIHLSFHSFTSELYGKVRDYEAGILFDPARVNEKKIAKELIRYLTKHAGIRVKSNKPYKGSADGHTTSLRSQFSKDRYTGIEIELSHKLSIEEMLGITDVIATYFQPIIASNSQVV
ncbi:MAG: hypothetical protein C0602_05610 [Denitrovibrio sp.]|nr:MAG: hypothetical protein C0602_05610 [Denitrovibrio sp.]